MDEFEEVKELDEEGNPIEGEVDGDDSEEGEEEVM